MFLPPAHYIYNKLYTWIVMIRGDGHFLESMIAREMSLQNLKRSSKTIFKNRNRLYNVLLTIVFMIFIEALELMYVFNLVETSTSANPVIH